MSLLLAVLAGLWLLHHRVHRYDQRLVTPTRAETSAWPAPRVAIVFGAGVYSDGSPSPMLEDRVRTAATLYAAGKVDRILVSGDNREASYNEPRAMRDALLERAVAAEHIILDYAGRSTYETCLRARDIFGVRRALLVTQEFHLPRALYLANSLGIEAWGVIADRRDYGPVMQYQEAREMGAEIKAFFNIHGFPPDVLLGEKLPVK
ncbi:MAG: vancomycin high temperature exclusion protein [Blastocatellia bacterium]